MCLPGLDPLTMGLMALSAAGQGISAHQQNRHAQRQQQTQNALIMQEMNRQRQFQREAEEQFQPAMDRFRGDAPQQNLEEAQGAQREAVTGNIRDADPSQLSAPASTPQVVTDSIAGRIFDNVADSRDMADRRANLEGFNRNFFGDQLVLGDVGRRLDTTRNLASTSASLLPGRIQSGVGALGQPNTGFGDILGAAGRLGAFGTGRGWFNLPTQPSGINHQFMWGLH